MFGADLPGWRRLSGAARRTTFGGDCYAYGLVALGHIDIVAESDMKIWDWAALGPVIEGAGGRVVDWQGRPKRAGGDGRTLAVGDPALLAEALRLLSGEAN
jgi:myo-inositol-1(or 4)-monophosphatase